MTQSTDRPIRKPEAPSGIIGIVCGLKSEVAAVEASVGSSHIGDVKIGVSGANASRARNVAQKFADENVKALLSVGVSGALDPQLCAGDLLVTTTVLEDTGSAWAPVELAARAAMLSTMGEIGDVSGGAIGDAAPLRSVQYGVSILGSDDIIQTPAQKKILFQKTQAIAVDMESHAVARVAAAHDIPFLAVRAIADPADRALPSTAMNAVAPDGSTRIAATLLACAKAPGQFPALLQLGSDSNKALASLRRDLGGLISGLFSRLDL